ncbi:type IV pilus biogenesis protein PilM [Alkalihalobacillus pseudalcaliphilus]|uniref:type IV pilus biogenesis protein PilM n=1 Tax=Alkalihalobacillus pseudalcaliphilus TaxID=79884 RepID=UPI00064D7C7D|nr:pilus assembly protein PilM [Alkalihalobacillus pseudalcaliphilus]KMK74660.1 hypothetical protein AB990_19385 [Alkalihalobacillus pseudalcaliphilus]
MKVSSLWNQKRHALILKDEVIRFVTSKKPDLRTITYKEELTVPVGYIENGVIRKEEELIEFITPYIEKWGLKKTKIQLCLPDSQLVIRRHFVPRSTSNTEVKAKLYFELGESLILPWDDPLLDIAFINKGEKEDEVLIFACQQTIIQQLQQFFEKLSVEINAIDVSPLMNYRLLHSMAPQTNGQEVIIAQVDKSSICFTIFEEEKPLFFRHLYQEGEEMLIQEVAAATEAKESSLVSFDLLSQELERIIHFYRYNVRAGKGQYERLLLCGDHPALPGIEAFLAEQFEFPVSRYQVDSHSDRFYDAYGLLLKKEVQV